MIVCHCRVVNDDAVARAVGQGAQTVAQVCRLTGAGQDCGACVFSLKRLVCNHVESAEDSYLEVESAAG